MAMISMIPHIEMKNLTFQEPREQGIDGNSSENTQFN